ncbi:hypothetical protein B0O99DRAFT_530206, partial [Bisporella sp. PMI_857]
YLNSAFLMQILTRVVSIKEKLTYEKYCKQLRAISNKLAALQEIQEKKKKRHEALNSINSPLFVVFTLINQKSFVDTLINTECFLYRMIDLRFARKHNLLRINISFRFLKSFGSFSNEAITEIAVVKINISGYTENRAYLYVVLKLSGHDMIFGLL